MYAMLTGFLPYMMEPFNVMEMYEKMMQRKMTPIPSFLSQGKDCKIVYELSLTREERKLFNSINSITSCF